MSTLAPEIFKAYDIRGLYGQDIDADAAVAIARAFARVIAEQEEKPTSELKLGLGRDMRVQAPELAAAYRDGMCAEGATVLDAGMVGTEILYYLVGSRDLDGGLMCTASHNPKAYTGAKLVRRGAIALSGEAGIDRVRASIEAGPSSRCRWSSMAATAWPGRWSGRCSIAWGSTRRTLTGRPTATSPTTSPIRCCPRTESLSCRKWDGRRRIWA
jgi:hypothetical protein